MNRADRIARLGRVPDLEWRVRAVMNKDLKVLARRLEHELNSAMTERFHLSMMMERPEKNGLVLVFHRPYRDPEEMPGPPPDIANPDTN